MIHCKQAKKKILEQQITWFFTDSFGGIFRDWLPQKGCASSEYFNVVTCTQLMKKHSVIALLLIEHLRATRNFLPLYLSVRME